MYIDRPDLIFAASKYSMAGEMCYAEFLWYYYLIYKAAHNDNQPEELYLQLTLRKKSVAAMCHLFWDIMCLINTNI